MRAHERVESETRIRRFLATEGNGGLLPAAGDLRPETWRWPASARIWTRLDSLTEQPLLCVTVKVRSRSLQKPADGASRRIYASRQVRGGVPSLTSTHGSRHAARRPGPIGAWTAVTPVTAVHPPFAFLWSAVKECLIGAPMDVAAALLRVLARKLRT